MKIKEKFSDTDLHYICLSDFANIAFIHIVEKL